MYELFEGPGSTKNRPENRSKNGPKTALSPKCLLNCLPGATAAVAAAVADGGGGGGRAVARPPPADAARARLPAAAAVTVCCLRVLLSHAEAPRLLRQLGHVGILLDAHVSPADVGTVKNNGQNG